MTSGRSLFAGDSGDVAIIGATYASSQSLGVGSDFSVNGTSVSVVGIFTSGTTFGDNAVIMPLSALQAILGTSGISEAYVTVDSVGNVDSVVTALQNLLGSNYDVISNTQLASSFQSSIDSIESSAQTAVGVSLLTAIAVVVFLMVLITRERTREIGVLKAIGFSNASIVAQYTIESVVLAVLGFAVSVGLAYEIGPTIAGSFLGSAAPGGGGFGHFAGRVSSGASSFTLTPDLLIYALVLAVVIGIVGAIYPIVRAVRLEPAEALRYE